MTPFTALGIMSGTSLDGVDIACCLFWQDKGQWVYEIIHAETYEYPAEWRSILGNLENMDAFSLAKTHADYGHFLGKLAIDFVREFKAGPAIIASHGHTIFHQPSRQLTFQLGDGAAIAAETGLPVVCDFRSMDVAMGGQGAPLVPLGDKILFPGFDYCLNLGGFSNISFARQGSRIAFDISPCNIILNHYAEKRLERFDNKGEIASRGEVHEGLLRELNDIPYYMVSPPKSLAKEWLTAEFLPVCEKHDIPIPTALRTIVEHIAIQVGRATAANNYLKILATGGGAKNDFLVSRIRALANHQLVIPDDLTVDYKEAMIFAFLGVMRYNREINVLHSVTGSMADHIGGAVYYR